MALESALKQRSFGETERQDAWWLQPAATFAGLAAFVVYSTWAAFQGEHYTFGPYLSPMYSPELWGNSHHALFGPPPGWWPSFLPFSPAFLILWAPGGFRFTCYYYRGAYYKAFWADPIQCGVGEPRKGYRGENSLPLILQNIHRYFLYFALIFIVFLSYDAIAAFFFEDGFGVGVGSLVLTLNVIFLAGYTFGCHSLRHLVGGGLNVFSKNPVRKTCWDCVTSFNKKHMVWAWFSLVWVGFTDFYVRMCSMGIWTDLRLI